MLFHRWRVIEMFSPIDIIIIVDHIHLFLLLLR
jgi:hypothetical protein